MCIRKKFISWTRLLIIAGLLSLCGCENTGFVSQFPSQITETIPNPVTKEFSLAILDKYRPEDAARYPDFSGEITDIRFSVAPREYVGQSTGIEFVDSQYRNKTLLQVYYGYQTNGQWYDIPCENYDLKGIFDLFHDYTGFEAAGDSHIVKIGPYLVICVQHSSADTPQWATFCTFHDNLDSQAVQYFSDYYTTSADTAGYGYFKEDPSFMETGHVVDYSARSTFDMYYFLILDYETLPKDYELTVTFWEGLGNDCQTLDYDDIITLLEE